MLKNITLASKAAVLAVLVMASIAPLHAEGPGKSRIIRCKNSLSDRPDPECAATGAAILNDDGSQRGIYPPTLTIAEREERDAADAAKVQAAADVVAAQSLDAKLLRKYPNEAAHQRARQVELQPMRRAEQQSLDRLAELAVKRKALDDEADFYKNKPLPPALKGSIGANEALVAGLKGAMQRSKESEDRVNEQFDRDLSRLKVLWPDARVANASSRPQR